MASVQYSELQVEVANLLKGAPSEVIDEVVTRIGDQDKRHNEELNAYPVRVSKEESDSQIRMKILDQPDWRKRASLAALLISRSLD